MGKKLRGRYPGAAHRDAIPGIPVCYVLSIWAALFFLDSVVRVYTGSRPLSAGSLLSLLLTLPPSFLLASLSSLAGTGINRALSFFFLLLPTVFAMLQTVYFTVFHTFFSLYSIVGASAVMEFNQDVLEAFADARWPLALLLAPLAAWFVRGRRFIPPRRLPLRAALCLAAGFFLSQFAAWALIQTMSEGAVSTRYLYQEAFVPTLTVERFGIFTAARLDARNLLFPREAQPSGEAETQAQTQAQPEPPPGTEAAKTALEAGTGAETGYTANTLDIDFDALTRSAPNQTIRGMHDYFRQVKPTLKNKYTGMFRGKNLIW
ncbi:MAG: hypothetical protein LBK13_10940, partial [Spirochaetales bacterium]|nr:hypothetical protein [Spirochaetales bacterium]